MNPTTKDPFDIELGRRLKGIRDQRGHTREQLLELLEAVTDSTFLAM